METQLVVYISTAFVQRRYNIKQSKQNITSKIFAINLNLELSPKHIVTFAYFHHYLPHKRQIAIYFSLFQNSKLSKH